MDPSGSRIFEALWRASDALPPDTTGKETKEAIAKALAPVSDRLANSKYGHFVENLVSSAVYKANPDRWRNAKLGNAAAKAGGGGKKRPGQQKGQHDNAQKRQKQN